jgi:hypothetical protein
LVPIFLLLSGSAFAANRLNVAKRKSPKAATSLRPKPAAPKEAKQANEKQTVPVMGQEEKQGKASVESVRAKVEVKSANGTDWKAAKTNTTLSTADTIRTGSRSTARVRLADGSKILLLQNSQAELENLSTVQKAIKLIRGRVRAVVKRLNANSEFKIKTPIGVASVRGTEFEVEFVEDGGNMFVDVLSGQVGVSRLGDLGSEVMVNPGESIKFGTEGELGDPIRSGAAPLDRQGVNAEVQDARVKDSVIAMAAEELRNADYQTAKSLIDVDGRRVRVEEYITRPAANQFKLVSLNERDSRFDYFTYTGTFNTTLPEDLSVALGEVNGKLGTDASTYYLTDYEMLMSNTRDKITDVGSGGHLVKITMSGSGDTAQYTLTNVDDQGVTTTRTVDAAAVQSDGSYKIYNPINDTFQSVSAADKDEALAVTVLDDGNYRSMTSADTFWNTRYNETTFRINDVVKTSFAVKSGVTNVLALDLDGTFTNQPIVTISEFPTAGSLHNRLTLYYSDGSTLKYDNYIIDDEGKMATKKDFAGLSNTAAYQKELLKWNYQQKVKASEMKDEINLVFDPRIGTMSGLIQQ